MTEKMPLIFGQQDGHSRETPVFVGLEKLGGGVQSIKTMPEGDQIVLARNCEVYVRRVLPEWASMPIGMFECGVSGLHCLLRGRKIAAGNRIQVLRHLRIHDALLCWRYRWDSNPQPAGLKAAALPLS